MTDDGLLDDVTGAYGRLTEDEMKNLGIVLGAYRSFRGDRRKHVAYVSMPITSGKRFYEVLSAEGVTSSAELAAKLGKDALYELVIKPNLTEGIALADELGATKDLLFIAPSVFEAKKWRWSQDAYMSLWYRVQAELSGSHYLMDGWEYSTGGVKEVVFTFLMQYGFVSRFSAEWREEHDMAWFNDLPLEQKVRELGAMKNVRLYRKAEGEWLEAHLDSTLWKAVRGLIDLHERRLPYLDLLPHVRRLAEIGQMTHERGMDPDKAHTGYDSPLFKHAVAKLNQLMAS